MIVGSEAQRHETHRHQQLKQRHTVQWFIATKGHRDWSAKQVELLDVAVTVSLVTVHCTDSIQFQSSLETATSWRLSVAT
jgi:hypothetical protein